MVKKTADKVVIKALPVAKLLKPNVVVKADPLAVEFRKLNEIGELLWLPSGLDEEEKNIRVLRALELYESIKPEGGMEGMLAAQMVGTHSAALECLRRAAIDGQTCEGRNLALAQAQKLMSLYTKQVAALDKHRGKGQQKVTVEHVNVEAGGQAIVGNVEVGRSNQSGPTAQDSEPDALEQAPEVPLSKVRSKSATAHKKP